MKDIQRSIDEALSIASELTGGQKNIARIAIHCMFALCKAIYWGLGKAI